MVSDDDWAVKIYVGDWGDNSGYNIKSHSQKLMVRLNTQLRKWLDCRFLVLSIIEKEG